jgi:hypothetical protein
MKRPPDARWISQLISAVIIGLRGKAIATDVPSVTRSVVIAAAASGRNGSFLISGVTMPS